MQNKGTHERMQVLKMVEDGKITVDEATKLFEAMNFSAYTVEESKNFDEKFNKFASDMKDFAKDVACKVNELAKKVEPKVKEVAKNVVAGTANIADNISKSLNEKLKASEGCCGEEGCGCEENTNSQEDCGCCCTSENSNQDDNTPKCN